MGETRTYKHDLTMQFYGAREVEVSVAFSVDWGRPATAPSYSHGGLPADPDEVHDVTVTHIDGAVVVGPGLSEEARALEAVIEGSADLMAALLECAAEKEAEHG